MSAAGLMCANQGCPAAAECARFAAEPLLAAVFPFAPGSADAERGDFVPDRTGRCPRFARRQVQPAPASSRPRPAPRRTRQGRLL